jgi:hypothetical protein
VHNVQSRKPIAILGRIALVAGAAAAALLPLPPHAIERLYSAGSYAVAQPWVTRASNLVPFALLDVAIVAALAAWIVLAGADIVRRRSWAQAVGRVAGRTAVWTAALYLVFLAAWGLNYRRVPLAEKLDFDEARVSADAARDLGLIAVGRVNALHAAAHAELRAGAGRDGEIDAVLARAFAAAQQDLGAASLAAPARPKRTMIDLYLRRAGVSGMTDPLFLETILPGDLLPVERPFVVAHEWSHLAGITDEGEANFAGWLTCLRGAAAHQYSGWLFLVGELARAVRDADRAAMSAALASGPRDDLRAIAERIRNNVSPRVSAAGWRAYNSYLKANRVESGTDSYAEVVKLVLGVEFERGWVPQKRDAP